NWKSLAATLPEDTYLHVIREDPKRKGFLYLGTERGLMFSPDDGGSWRPLKLNRPAVAVHDLLVKGDDLVVGTNGRSIWILDDLTPIREWSPALPQREVHLFAPVAAHRWRFHSPSWPQASGDNPPAGAILYYYLEKKAEGEVTIEVTGAQGNLIAKLSSEPEPEEEPTPGDYEENPEKEEPKKLQVEPGLHRVVWDLRHKGAGKIAKAKVDSGDATKGPLVCPGRYTLKLNAGGKSATVELEVLPDPRLSLSTSEWAEEERYTLGLRDAIGRLSGMVMDLRAVREQLESRGRAIEGTPSARPLLEGGRKLIEKLTALEEKLHNPRAKVAYDILAQKGGAKLYSRMIFLYSNALAAD